MDSLLYFQATVPLDKYLELNERVKEQQDTIAGLQEGQLVQAQQMIEALATIAYVGIVDGDVLPSGTLAWLEEIRGADFFEDEEI